MSRLSWFILFTVLLFSVSSSYAITDEEIFRAFSLNLSTPGARAVGMGGAFIARADDATATETNPAGLTILARPEVSLEYRHVSEKRARTELTNVPITNLDKTPTGVEPGQVYGVADFSASDTLQDINGLGFAGIVYPFRSVTFGLSRHELIDADAFVSGSLTASPFHFLEPNSFEGTASIRDVNYLFTAAAKMGEYFSLGGSLKIADFSIQSNVGARQKNEQEFGLHFTSLYDTSDQKIGFNVGVLAHATPVIAIGAVYKYEPRFTLKTVLTNVDSNPPSQVVNDIEFDVPDSLGLGISIGPSSIFTVNVDIVRVFYSQFEDVESGFSLFTHLLPFPTQDIVFRINDSTDIHVGAEYLFNAQSAVFAVRGGYYREGRNRFFFQGAPAATEFLRPIFGTNAADPLNHFTFGTGFTWNRFQLDFAADYTREANVNETENLTTKVERTDSSVEIIISSVVRF